MFLFAYLRYFIRYIFPTICLLPILTVFSATASANTIFLNEIHYDNSGGDINEGVEIAGPSGSDLSGWQLLLYNGNGGRVYGTVDLVGTIPELSNGWGLLSFATPGVQNGPDGFALVDNLSKVVQFLSYEGVFMATDGAADGLSSEMIGAEESPSTSASHSLQLVGNGRYYNEFQWFGPQDQSFGAINSGQSITSTTPSAVPTPATLPLLLSGFMLFGALAQSRRI